MLVLYRSNRLEALLVTLARLLEQEAGRRDPFEPQVVVVGGAAVARWLREALATELGSRVAANLAFPYPEPFLASLLEALPDADEPWRRGALPWALAQLLERPPAGPLADYLLDEPPGLLTPRGLSLARELARIFDRLAVHRPELVARWERGQLDGLPPELGWLPRLWHELRRGPLRGPPPLPLALGRLLDDAAPLPAGPLRFFGVEALPPVYLRALGRLSHRLDVELFAWEPSREPWFDLKPGGSDEQAGAHPLLDALGRRQREQQALLLELSGSVPSEQHELFVDPLAGGPATALRQLQAQLLHLRDPRVEGPAPLPERDDSLAAHACPGPARQAQVLRDALLHLLDAHTELEPRDVLVLCPDPETFYPLLDAAFSSGTEDSPQPGPQPWGPAGAPRLPLVLAERTLRNDNPVAEALLALLRLCDPAQRLTASAVLDLLDHPPFRRRFGIAASELPAIRDWVREARIRWGWDARERAAAGLPPSEQNTWRFGLERLALGVALADRDGLVFDPPEDPEQPGLAPVEGLEGESTELLGRFLEACDALFAERERLSGRRGIEDWHRLLAGDPSAPADSPEALGTLERLFQTTEASRWLLHRVREQLDELLEDARAGGFARQLDARGLHDALAAQLEGTSSPGRLANAVRLAPLRPHQLVPARVVALLGLDDGTFPRSSTPRRFDPLSASYRPGDPDPRAEDRALLLDALLAARDHFLLLYTDRDPQTGQEVPPPPPVSDFLEALDLCLDGGEQPASARLLRHHPLHAHSAENFQPGPDGRPWSYELSVAEALARDPLGSPPPFFPPDLRLPPPSADSLELDELVRTFHKPAQSFLERVLGLYLPPEPGREALDREPVEPDLLETWTWTERVLDELQGRIENAELRLRAEGRLPAGPGWLDGPRARAAEIRERISALLALPAERLPVELELEPGGEPLRLRGSVGPVHGDTLVLFTASSLDGPKPLLTAWLHLLAAALARKGGIRRALLASAHHKAKPPREAGSRRKPARPGSKLQLVELLLPPDPEEHLEDLLLLWREAQQRPLPLFPRASLALAVRALWVEPPLRVEELCRPETAAGKRRETALKAVAEARRELHATRDGAPPGELDDAYAALLWRGRSPVDGGPGERISRDFAELSLRLWHPLLTSWKEFLPA